MPDYDSLVNESVNKANRTVNGRALTPAEQLAKHQQQVQRQNYIRMADRGLASQLVPNAMYTAADAQRDRNLEVDGDYIHKLTEFYAEPSASVQPVVVANNVSSAATPIRQAMPVQNMVSAPAQAVKVAPKSVAQLPKGSAEVIALQKQLNTNGAGLKEDGIYGPRTAEAVFASYNKEDPEVAAFNSGYRPEYKPGPLQNVTVDSVRRGDAPVPAKGLAARANRLYETTAYRISGDAPEGYIPHASYEKFSDMFRRGR